MTPIDDTNYAHILREADQPVLLVFMGAFCGPSAMMLPLIDGLAEDYGDSVIIFDVDVETCPKLTRAMQVKGTPGMVLLNKGEPIASRLGTSNYADLTAWLTKNTTGINL